MNRSDGMAIIIGAAGGIGKAVSCHLSNKYKIMVLSDFNANKLEEVCKEIRDDSKETVIIPCVLDIKDYEATNKKLQEYCQAHKVDLLVNCAGISMDGTSEIEYNDFNNILQTNLMGSFNTIKAVLPFMKKNNHGYIVNLVSKSGKRARPKTGAYAASKFALIGYIEGLQKELVDTNINITSLCPGMVATSQTDDEPHIPKEDMIQPNIIAKTIEFLLSLPLNTNINEIVIDCKKQILIEG